MNQVVLFAILSASSLMLGAVISNFFKMKKKIIALFMAFGSGVFICALTFGLIEEAFKHGGLDATIIGFLIGGIVFVSGDYLILKYGGRKHRKRKNPDNETSGEVITLGAILDAVPESAALGIALASSTTGGILILIAIVLNNFPESLVSGPGLKKEGFSSFNIFSLWTIVSLISIAVTILSFIYLKDLDPNFIGIFEAFAAGAILGMLANTMIPEAYEDAGPYIGLVTITGFLVAFIISKL